MTGADVRALRDAATQFGGRKSTRKAALLRDSHTRLVDDPDVLVAWHDCLLYLLAYPESRALLVAARAELERVARASRRIAEDGPARSRKRLAGHGVAWSELTIAFGWDIARWLAQRFPRHAEIDSFGDDGVPVARVLAAALPSIEFELIAANEEHNDALLEEACANYRKSRLAWLVGSFERLECADAVRDVLFDAIRPFIRIRSGGSMLSRTRVRGLPGPTFFHRDRLIRDVDVPRVLADPLPPARRLAHADRIHAIDAARAMLAALGRETDAIAKADPAGVAWHDVGRGVAVALYAIRAERREPLDSHIGMMLFKNGLPVGYGGGWPFLGTCRIGINIFEPYRGGESAFLFAQVLRVYHRRFGITRFVAEPSQFGGRNLEGLRSGAFWFYYRLGFRPVDARAATLAAGEFARIESERGYRTPVAALRRFTGTDIELVLPAARGNLATCDPADLSLAATHWIDERFAGDRDVALAQSVRLAARALGVRRHEIERWPEHERRAFASFSLLLAQIDGLSRWPAPDRRAFVTIIRAKGSDEYRFHRLLQRARRVRSALARVAAPFAHER